MKIDLDTYLAAAALINPFVAGLHVIPFDPGGDVLPDAVSAVYIAADETGEVVYVGSVRRRSSRALRDRIAEHLRDRPEAAAWKRVWVLRMSDESTTGVVRWAEARVGRHFQPAGNRRLPRFPGETARMVRR